MYGGGFYRRGFTFPQTNRYFDRCYARKSLQICDAVINETIIDRELRNVKRNTPILASEWRYLKYSSYGRFKRLERNCVIPNNDDRLCDVEDMYESIWADASQRNNIELWAEIKTKTTGKAVRPKDGPRKALTW